MAAAAAVLNAAAEVAHALFSPSSSTITEKSRMKIEIQPLYIHTKVVLVSVRSGERTPNSLVNADC